MTLRRTADDTTPPSVALVQEFLNTLDLERFGPHASTPDEQRDRVRTPQLLREWLTGYGLLRAGARVTRSDVADCGVLRAALRARLRAEQGLGFDARALEEGERLAARLPLSVGLEPGAANLQPLMSGARGALGRLLAEFATASASGELRRLKVCSAEDCQFVFFDHSKSRTQRWCAMEVCGNREKTRRYRALHRHG